MGGLDAFDGIYILIITGSLSLALAIGISGGLKETQCLTIETVLWSIDVETVEHEMLSTAFIERGCEIVLD